jgi:hypothetical protein
MTRAELIEAGILVPGTGLALRRTQTPATVRLDDIGRAAARRYERAWRASGCLELDAAIPRHRVILDGHIPE